MNSKCSERVALLATLDPVSQSAATVLTDACEMKYWGRILFILSVGALGASATVDARIVQATTSGGTYKAISPAVAITQLTKAGSDDNKQVLIEIRADQLDKANSYDWVKLEVTVATAACLISAVALGFDPRYAPASDNDLASVDEIV